MSLRKDIWRPAIVDAPLGDIVRRGSLDGLDMRWLPPMGAFRFLADPFGLWRDERLHIFVEAYDYRVRVGTIEVLVYDPDFQLVGRGLALAEPWHLSYPFVFEAEGEIWMMPEAARSGRLTLYRALDFPYHWEAAHEIALDHDAIDATPLFHAGLWWLFYTSPDREAGKFRTLHIAFAARLQGPWHPHRANPVRIDVSAARPGGTPQVIDDRVMLPVQDCSRTYGGAIRPLWFDVLTPDIVRTRADRSITPPSQCGAFIEGLHTLAAAGDVTLIDVKKTELSLHGLAIEARREADKLVRRWKGA